MEVLGLFVTSGIFATEPVPTGEIIDRFFPVKEVGAEAAPKAGYDMHTCHAEAFGRHGNYLYSASEVLNDIGAFVAVSSEVAS